MQFYFPVVAVALLMGVADLDTNQESGANLVSTLMSKESTLASVSYLFQGLPDRVVVSSFEYAEVDGRKCEDYLVQLLDTSKPGRSLLRDCAIILSSRLYVNDTGRSYLVLSKHDAALYVRQLADIDGRLLSREDLVLRQALVSYCELKTDREAAKRRWMTVVQASVSVNDNIKGLLERLTVVNQVEDGWRHPFPIR